MSRILAIDDEQDVFASLRRRLQVDGHELATVPDGAAALAAIAARCPDLVLLDLQTDEFAGLQTLKRIKHLAPAVPVVLMTAAGSTDTAIQAMQLGAFDYLRKPFEAAELNAVIRRALATVAAANASACIGAAGGDEVEGIVGRSPQMFRVYKAIGQVAAAEVTVLIRGESGTGKEMVARSIHAHSPRAGHPFVAVNCAALPEPLLESELFGHEKGAFTGAVASRPGRFEQAEKGTLLLDEVGDMALSTQSKVLRLLQERTVERLGSSKSVCVDVRLLAATHQDLERLVGKGAFRADLYWRLRVATIELTPLRERREDIVVLVSHFLRRLCQLLGRDDLRVAPAALQRLEEYRWPGNVRELEHCLHQAALFCHQGVILPEDLRLAEGGVPVAAAADAEVHQHDVLRDLARAQLAKGKCDAHPRLVEKVDGLLIEEALRKHGGNLSRAALALGISRPTLRERIRRLGLSGWQVEEQSGE